MRQFKRILSVFLLSAAPAFAGWGSFLDVTTSAYNATAQIWSGLIERAQIYTNGSLAIPSFTREMTVDLDPTNLVFSASIGTNNYTFTNIYPVQVSSNVTWSSNFGPQVVGTATVDVPLTIGLYKEIEDTIEAFYPYFVTNRTAGEWETHLATNGRITNDLSTFYAAFCPDGAFPVTNTTETEVDRGYKSGTWPAISHTNLYGLLQGVTAGYSAIYPVTNTAGQASGFYTYQPTADVYMTLGWSWYGPSGWTYTDGEEMGRLEAGLCSTPLKYSVDPQIKLAGAATTGTSINVTGRGAAFEPSWLDVTPASIHAASGAFVVVSSEYFRIVSGTNPVTFGDQDAGNYFDLVELDLSNAVVETGTTLEVFYSFNGALYGSIGEVYEGDDKDGSVANLPIERLEEYRKVIDSFRVTATADLDWFWPTNRGANSFSSGGFTNGSWAAVPYNANPDDTNRVLHPEQYWLGSYRHEDQVGGDDCTWFGSKVSIQNIASEADPINLTWTRKLTMIGWLLPAHFSPSVEWQLSTYNEQIDAPEPATGWYELESFTNWVGLYTSTVYGSSSTPTTDPGDPATGDDYIYGTSGTNDLGGQYKLKGWEFENLVIFSDWTPSLNYVE